MRILEAAGSLHCNRLGLLSEDKSKFTSHDTGIQETYRLILSLKSETRTLLGSVRRKADKPLALYVHPELSW